MLRKTVLLPQPEGPMKATMLLRWMRTWLSRTWHGQVHQVIVLDGGYEYAGTRYSSLSAIARLITGAGWSGPRFFGLHSPRLGKLGVSVDG